MSAMEEVQEITETIKGVDGDIIIIEEKISKFKDELKELNGNKADLVDALKEKVAEL